MRIHIRKDAASAYHHRCYKGAHPACGMLHNPDWEKMLEQVQGQWLEVETEHLFRDQFNTAPIPGVSELGMRIMIQDIDAIEDDARDGIIKCNWCFGYDKDNDGKCDNCSKSEYLEPLNPIKPTS